MYNTMMEVLIAVREKFSLAKSLSKENSGACFYGHDYNGIGCAIGCLYPAEIAEEMDSVGAISAWSTATWNIYKDNMFGLGIRRDSLRVLQEKHDRSDTVEEFLLILDRRIATGRWISVKKARKLIQRGASIQ